MKTLLALHIMKDYNEEEQFTVLLSVLQDYDIIKKLKTIIIDNSDINNTLCQEIKDYFLSIENLM